MEKLQLVLLEQKVTRENTTPNKSNVPTRNVIWPFGMYQGRGWSSPPRYNAKEPGHLQTPGYVGTKNLRICG